MENEVALLGKQPVEPVDRQEQRAGEDVLLDEIHAFTQLIIAGIGTRDKLQGDQAVALE